MKPKYTVTLLLAGSAFLTAALLAACGGSSDDSGSAGAPAQGGAAGSAAGAAGTAGSAGSAGTAGASGAPDGGRVPAEHRPEAATCSPNRDPGYIDSICGTPGTGPEWVCKGDSDCTEGKNGRCFGNVGGAGCMGTFCSYDQCSEDKDCASGLPCMCRSSLHEGANVCASGSSCATDADCGAGGFCSPSGVYNCGMAWFCHTPEDSCIDNSDCVDGGNANECSFDKVSKRWRCDQSTCHAVP